MKKPSLSDVKKGLDAVNAVHGCPECMKHLEAIKECRRNGHKHE